jgi:hypothetical protein
MPTVSSATERERLPISVAICSPLIAAVLRGVSSRYEFAIGNLCARQFWDTLAAHSGTEQRGCQSHHENLRGSASALTGQDARTAHLFLEMHWRDESASKGLTKSAFEALVRSALQGSDNENRVSRAEVHTRVGRVLPQHTREQLSPYVEAALKRLTKLAVRHWTKDDTFNLSFEEKERLKDRKASVALLVDAFDGDVDDLLKDQSGLSEKKREEVVELLHRIFEHYFLRQGENFASALARDSDYSLDDENLKLVIEALSPSSKLVAGRDNVQFLLHVVGTLMASPSAQTKEYLRLLADTYTLFAFLEEVPDVQKVTKKLFNHGELWLDTTILLPLFAEQAFPESLRPFTALFKQADASSIKLRLRKVSWKRLNAT